MQLRRYWQFWGTKPDKPACCTGVDMDDGLPDNEYREYFAPDYRLQLQSDPAVADQNTKEYTDSVVREVLTQLSRHAQLTSLFV